MSLYLAPICSYLAPPPQWAGAAAPASHRRGPAKNTTKKQLKRNPGTIHIHIHTHTLLRTYLQRQHHPAVHRDRRLVGAFHHDVHVVEGFFQFRRREVLQDQIGIR